MAVGPKVVDWKVTKPGTVTLIFEWFPGEWTEQTYRLRNTSGNVSLSAIR